MVFQVPSRLIAVLPPTLAIKGEADGEETGEGLLWPEAGAISSGTVSSGATSEKPSTNNAPTMFRFIVFSLEVVARTRGLYGPATTKIGFCGGITRPVPFWLLTVTPPEFATVNVPRPRL